MSRFVLLAFFLAACGEPTQDKADPGTDPTTEDSDDPVPCPDSDVDGVCDDDDVCDGDDLSGDSDGDGICDASDLCPFDDPDDSDGDGVCDSDDACVGDDASGDTDGDGVCDDTDPCPLDDPDDEDGDGICDADDLCWGDDASGDSDGDGECDSDDSCPFDNPDDSDGDGVCDSDDLCAGDDATGDSDGDGTCDSDDLCFGGDASGDSDGDGVCDDTDACPLDDPDDSDADGVCDSDDLCVGDDATGDSDGDGVCDNLDACPFDAPDDSDGDGVCDSDDLCLGDDASGDSDGDGECDDSDSCPFDDPDDGDGDGVCDSDDLCAGDDATGDSDGDGTCDDNDLCFGDDGTGDSDGDGVCDDTDPCPVDDPDDTDGDGVCDADDLCLGDDALGDADGDGICGAGLLPFGMASRPANPNCIAPAEPAPPGGVILQAAFNGAWFDEPLAAEQPPDNPDLWFVAEREGRLRSFNTVTGFIYTALDLRPQVDVQGEGGLLGIALHPDFDIQTDPEIFIHYTTFGTASVISKFVSYDGGATFDIGSEEVLVGLNQPTIYHNGGDLAFGHDGLLYASFGDGEGTWLYYPHPSQDPYNFLGTVIRLDPDGGVPYAIPPDNPFAGGGGAPEVFAWGLRNPWRMSFDMATGDLWVGDVGDGQYEEIDIVENGENYGWPDYEGFNCVYFPCTDPSMVAPVFQYDHSYGAAVIGGFVYRGTDIPSMYGHYIFSDWVGGNVWATSPEDLLGLRNTQLILNNSPMGAAWAQGLDGEVYLLTGQFMKLVLDPGGPADPFPDLLSETGCVDPLDPTQVDAGAIPYEVNMPLWSDDAGKNRWMAIPDGSTVALPDAEGHWEFPVESVLIKDFTIEGVRVETRLLVRHLSGAWAGYAYQWNLAGDDAFWVPNGAQVELPSGAFWSIPSQAQCMQCHTEAAGRTLGPDTAQMNRTFGYALGDSNQIDTLDHIGMFAGAMPDPATLDRHPELLSGDPVDERARAYLHANCAHCHRPGGSAPTNIDLRWFTPIDQTETCSIAPQLGNLGVLGASIVEPGDPSSSVLSLRMNATNGDRMPVVGTDIVDPDGTFVIDDWIANLVNCLP